MARIFLVWAREINPVELPSEFNNREQSVLRITFTCQSPYGIRGVIDFRRKNRIAGTAQVLSSRHSHQEVPIMNFRITGLAPDPFRALFGLSDEALASRGVRRYVVDRQPGFPDRIEMKDAELGQRMLLLNHVSQPANSPYRASHAVFIREGASQAYDAVNQVPEVMRIRLLSLRAFSEEGMLLDADVVDGQAIEPVITRLFANPEVSYIHVHNAKQGCYSGRIDRA
ncbi:DUF1203 domain-containing protein [Pseudomonas beijingensis]|nr:DUF1203 domain-containing protein [Pseudomonas sp. FP830]WLI43270.1 DUF1203 domain-containing protein [Pseudomonas sp. FP830]